MERVNGIGGVFFRAKDPAALALWYETHLGVSLAPGNDRIPPWLTDPGITIFAPLPETTHVFPKDKAFMLNFRVASLDRMLAQLRASGIHIEQEDYRDGIGRFARVQDPEGNPVELWEPVTA